MVNEPMIPWNFESLWILWIAEKFFLYTGWSLWNCGKDDDFGLKKRWTLNNWIKYFKFCDVIGNCYTLIDVNLMKYSDLYFFYIYI